LAFSTKQSSTVEFCTQIAKLNANKEDKKLYPQMPEKNRTLSFETTPPATITRYEIEDRQFKKHPNNSKYK